MNFKYPIILFLFITFLSSILNIVKSTVTVPEIKGIFVDQKVISVPFILKLNGTVTILNNNVFGIPTKGMSIFLDDENKNLGYIILLDNINKSKTVVPFMGIISNLNVKGNLTLNFNLFWSNFKFPFEIKNLI